jgi:propanediol utilization protein
MNEQDLRNIVKEILAGFSSSQIKYETSSANSCQDLMMEIPIEVSARHVHLTNDAVTALFGKSQLTNKKALSQPGQFLSEERVSLVTPTGIIKNVAVLGPARDMNQVELAKSDARILGLNPPIKLSGDINGAEDVTIVGSCGSISAKSSVIIAKSHIHMSQKDGTAYNLKNGDIVDVKIDSERPITFSDVSIRVGNDYSLAMHIDCDESNACAFSQDSSHGFIVNKASVDLKNNPDITDVPEKGSNGHSCNEIDIMSEKLITESKANSIIKSCNVSSRNNVIKLGKGVIITPSAKDAFNSARMSLEYVKE